MEVAQETLGLILRVNSTSKVNNLYEGAFGYQLLGTGKFHAVRSRASPDVSQFTI